MSDAVETLLVAAALGVCATAGAVTDVTIWAVGPMFFFAGFLAAVTCFLWAVE